MHVLKTKGEVGADGHLHLDLPAGPVELVLVLGSASRWNGANYDFTDIVGRLQWNGDALREQRNLRDEW
jgi:hypothetical protein